MKTKKRSLLKPSEAHLRKAVSPEDVTVRLLGEIRDLIDRTRERAAQAVNAGLVMLNWHIGDRIRKEILGGERAEYGEQIVSTLSGQLTVEYGRGFSRRNLFNMIRFAEVFPDPQIVQTLSAQLGWSHFLEIIYQKDDLKRDFYAEMCRIERWSVRTLRNKINGMLYERTALSRNTEELIRQELDALREEDLMTPDLVFRDPYFLDFLGLTGAYSEKDLEEAILREMEKFLLELGSDFSFVARQKRMTIGKSDFYLDLLFYHRRLRRLIAIDLKLGSFTAEHYGQMELYLRWLDKYERRSGEKSPLGLILCSEKDHEQIELLELSSRGIRVAEYLTELPPRSLLITKLNEARRLARERVKVRRSRK
ncbi:MAG: PDDEXK nuclease domain-containing protein [Acidobacteria bacterium]|nr:PDDEXK nuclease domain-containing protein [Acidobacteriota bacterium]